MYDYTRKVDLGDIPEGKITTTEELGSKLYVPGDRKKGMKKDSDFFC